MTSAVVEAPQHLADEAVATAPAYVPKLDDLAADFPVKRSASIAALSAALAKAQGAFPTIEKDRHAEIVMKAGGKYRYNYADLASVLDAIRKPMADNGLSQVQPVKVENNGVVVVTVLMHESGEWICSDPLPMRADMSEPRSVGSAISYARRYSLQAMLGLSPSEEDDDDAERASQPRNGGNGPARPSVQPAARRSQQQAAPAEQQQPEPPATSPTGAPANLGVVADIKDLPSGAIGVTLNTGYKCASKDAAIIEAMRGHLKSGVVVELTTKQPKPGFTPLIEEILVIPADAPAGEASA